MEAQLATFKLKKSKGKGKVRPFTSVTIVVLARKDLSYLPSPNTMLKATLRDMPLVTDTGVSLLPKKSPWHRIMETLVLVDEEGNEKAKEEGVEALKRKRRQKAFAHIEAISFKGTQSAELLKYQIIRAIMEAREGFSEVGALSFGAVTELIEAGMTSKNGSDGLKAFRAFTGAISAKLDVFEITSSWVKNSFFFGFRSLIQIGYSSLSPLPFFFF